jgi:hypothetical protein
MLALGWLGAPLNDADMALFRVSTKVFIGNGETTSFWHDIREAPIGFGAMIFSRLQLGRTAASQRRLKRITGFV